MNDLSRTLLTVALAGALAGAAYFTRPAPVRDAAFSDVGEPFNASFTDPAAASALRVVSLDETTATVREFEVKRDGERWVIPSHSNYPVEAKEKMAQAAAVFVGLTREQVISDVPADHAAMGVVDPLDEAAAIAGRGTRVTVSDARGEPLSDLIIGKPLKDGGPTGQQRYVRIPGKNRVYAVKFPASFSARFADWVETDLLKIGSLQIDRVVLDRYEVDEDAASIRPVERIEVTRSNVVGEYDENAPVFSVNSDPGGPPGEGEQVDFAVVNDMINVLRELRIVGVRPKPAKLAAVFAGEGGGQVTLDNTDLLMLASRGFHLGGDGSILANDGDLYVTTSDLVTLKMSFGELVLGDDDDVSAEIGAGALPDAAPGADEPADSPDEQAASRRENRFVFVTAMLDTSMLPPEPEPPAEPAKGEDGTVSAQAQQAYDAARVLHEEMVRARQSRLTQAQQRIDELNKRFAPWYYVIDASSFNLLRPSRARLITPRSPEDVGPRLDPRE